MQLRKKMHRLKCFLIYFICVSIVPFCGLPNTPIDNSCGNNTCSVTIGNPSPPVFSPAQSVFTDDEIRNAVYSDYKYPTLFYTDTGNDGSIYYVNSNSILPINNRSMQGYELCTDLQSEATIWCELSLQYGSQPRTYVSEYQNEKYFERLYTDSYNGITYRWYCRSHKCSYFQPNSSSDSSYVGIFNGIINDNSKKELIEYFWFLGNYNTYGSCALSSGISTVDLDSIAVIYDTQTVGGDWCLQDTITLRRIELGINPTNKRISINKINERIIDGACN